LRAVQLVRWQAEPELREIETPAPGPGEVLVRVQGAGLCHSDLHVMEFPEGTVPWSLPFTLGHENAGTVAALGAGTRGVAVGDAVLIYGPWGCGACRQCAQGAENLCARAAELRGRGCGLGYDGGLADYVVVPSARLLVPIGDLDPLHAAPLTDAALSPYSAIKRELGRLTPGSAAVVIGVGGLGHVAVQILRALSAARIVAVDLRERSRALALAAGAHVALDAAGLEPGDVWRETGPDGAAVVFDFVGNQQTVELAASLLSTGGHASILGVGGGTFPLAFGSVPLGASASRPTWGSLPELHEVVALARAGAIEIEVEQLRLEDAIDGYRRLGGGEIAGRAVVVP
jgi:propanol-preferring alcohol dehydrogenase